MKVTINNKNEVPPLAYHQLREGEGFTFMHNGDLAFAIVFKVGYRIEASDNAIIFGYQKKTLTGPVPVFVPQYTTVERAEVEITFKL